MLFINNSSNRQIVKDIVDKYGLSLVDPEIFLRFINNDLSSYDDVIREMIYIGHTFVNIEELQRQYEKCGNYLHSNGYIEIDTSKLKKMFF